MNTTLNYSLNFNIKKRKSIDIKFIVFHYTGMKKEKDAIKRLTSIHSKVSSHYFIKRNGEILTLVPDLYISWHAGVSFWKKFEFLNKNSIGIEISNPGHENKYVNYSKKQMSSVIKLTKFLIKKYKIKPQLIVGHSDISPDRKKDPGEKFPWKNLFRRKIGYWHNITQKILLKRRNQMVSKVEKDIFIKNLVKIGYSKKLNKKNNDYYKILTIAFQRRFRQELINGIVDKECLIISNNLANKY
tara:strand:+ start:1363 stop:2091 length:729 start_codon:yes stop_codon:yes gene_type:complete